MLFELRQHYFLQVTGGFFKLEKSRVSCRRGVRSAITKLLQRRAWRCRQIRLVCRPIGEPGTISYYGERSCVISNNHIFALHPSQSTTNTYNSRKDGPGQGLPPSHSPSAALQFHAPLTLLGLYSVASGVVICLERIAAASFDNPNRGNLTG